MARLGLERHSLPERWQDSQERKKLIRLAFSLLVFVKGHVKVWQLRKTGKSSIHIVLYSGLDYAIMSGGDVGPLGKDAVHLAHFGFMADVKFFMIQCKCKRLICCNRISCIFAFLPSAQTA